ncbi:MAG: site-specific DNA-methyltransferase [Clostridia bacterium]|nr:site-specific DNA-methyltransferase [Clostridia bacterium]
MKTVFEQSRQELINELDRRMEDGIIEKSNADLLKKLIQNADTLTEAIFIAELGTTYKRTGFHFDKRLEKTEPAIKYFKKNEELSFSDGSDKSPNKLIIGDNYDGLLNLLIQYKGKIDVIYIDPPYGKDSMGEFAQTNYENALTRDNLLSMLYSRLTLAKMLLSETGVIFCSIDDRNYAYVKCLMDEVFQERNYSGTIIWQKKKKPSFLSKNFGTMFEYILCYVANYQETFPFSVETTTVGKKYPFNNAGNTMGKLHFPPNRVRFNMPDGTVKAQDMSNGNIITRLLNDVVIEDGTNINEMVLEGEWRYSQETLDDEISKGSIITISQVPFRPNLVKDGGEIKKMGNMLSQVFYNCETNEDGTAQLEEILDDTFDNPKPVGLVQLLLKSTTYWKKEATVLDFFAGSGTTGQAVLELNKQDDGKRRFVLCQINEKTPVNPHGIAYDVTSKRLKRTMTGSCYDGSTDFKWANDNEPLGGSLDVYEIAEVANFESVPGQTAFDVIDETLYGQEKFSTLKEKIEWICRNFEGTQKVLESDADWKKRLEEDK